MILISCSAIDERENFEKDIISISSDNYLLYSNKPNFQVINLDSAQNFGELISKMSKLSCAGKIVGLKFSYKENVYNMMGNNLCPYDNTISCHFGINRITIKNDSLINYAQDWNNKVHIKNLNTELEKIIESKYAFQYGKDIPKPVLINLHIEDKFSIAKTKEVLSEIINQFNKINSRMGMGVNYFEYNILFEKYSILDIPPPPPPKLMKNHTS